MANRTDITPTLRQTFPSVYLASVEIDYLSAGAKVGSTPTFLFQENKVGGLFSKWTRQADDAIKYTKVAIVQTRTAEDKDLVAKSADKIIAALSRGSALSLSRASTVEQRIYDFRDGVFSATSRPNGGTIFETTSTQKFEFENEKSGIGQLSYFIGIFFDAPQFFRDNGIPYDERSSLAGAWTAVYDVVTNDVPSAQHVVRDYRVLKNALATFVADGMEIHAKRPVSFNVKENVKNWSYVSEAWASRDADNRANVAFAFDHLGAIRQASQLGPLVTAKQDWMEYFPIASFKLIQERVRRTNMPNSIGGMYEAVVPYSVASTPAEEVLCATMDGARRLFEIDTRKVGLKEMPIGTAPDGFRFFGFVDRAMPTTTDGLYRYKVEIKLADGSKRMLVKLRKSLMGSLRKMRELHESMERGRWFDPQRTRLRPDKRKEAEQVAEEVVGDVEQLWPSVLEMLTGRSQREALAMVRSLVRPATGSPDGLLRSLEFLSEFMKRLEDAIPDSFLSGVEGTSRSKISGANKTPGIDVNLQLLYVHDSNNRKAFGANIIDVSRGQFPSLDIGTYVERVDGERKRYSPEEERQGIPRQSLEYVYLTPSSFEIGAHGVHQIEKYDFSSASLDEQRVAKIKIQQAKMGSHALLNKHPKDATEKSWISKTLTTHAADVGITDWEDDQGQVKLTAKPLETLHAKVDSLKSKALPESLAHKALAIKDTSTNDGLYFDLTKELAKSNGAKFQKNDSIHGSSDGNFFNASAKYNIDHIRKNQPEKLSTKMPPSVQASLAKLKTKKERSALLGAAMPRQVAASMELSRNSSSRANKELGLDLLNLAYVEVLDAFEGNDVRRSTWKMLNDVTTLDTDTNYLCRLRPLSLLPRADEEGRMPIFNEYFVLST